MTLEAVALTNSLVRAKRQERYENSQRPPSRRPVWKQVLKGALPTIIIIAVGSVYLSVIHPRFAACRTDLQRSAVYFLAHHQRLARLLLRLVRMGVHLVRDLLGRSRFRGCQRRQGGREREDLVRHHALHRHRGLVHLPARLLLRVLAGQRGMTTRSTWCTTLLTSLTRSRSALPSGPASRMTHGRESHCSVES